MVPRAVVDALMEQLSTLQATVDRLTALLEEKEQIIRNQNRARFGQSSEKRTYLLADGQPRSPAGKPRRNPASGHTLHPSEQSGRPGISAMSKAAKVRAPRRCSEATRAW